jgi:hypothetical protein
MVGYCLVLVCLASFIGCSTIHVGAYAQIGMSYVQDLGNVNFSRAFISLIRDALREVFQVPQVVR